MGRSCRFAHDRQRHFEGGGSQGGGPWGGSGGGGGGGFGRGGGGIRRAGGQRVVAEDVEHRQSSVRGVALDRRAVEPEGVGALATRGVRAPL